MTPAQLEPSAHAPCTSTTLRASTGAEITAAAGWYDAEPDILNGSYDVVLALANDRGVRGGGGHSPTLIPAGPDVADKSGMCG